MQRTMRRKMSDSRLATKPQDMWAALEPRRLFGLDPLPGNKFTFTDVDGDLVTVQLTGPGTGATDPGSGDRVLDVIQFAGTTSQSKLSISVRKVGAGDGLANIGNFDGQSPIGSISADKVNLNGSESVFAGAVGAFKVRDVRADLTFGGDLLVPMTFAARSIVGTSNVEKAEIDLGVRAIKSFTANALLFVNLTAGATKALSVKPTGGALGGVFSCVLDFASVAGQTDTLGTATIADNLQDTGLRVRGRMKSLTARSIVESFINVDGEAAKIATKVEGDQFESQAAFYGTIALKGDVANTEITALGRDAQGTSLKSLTFVRGDNVSVFVPTGAVFAAAVPPGRIGAISCAAWLGGEVEAGSIGSITTKGSRSLGLTGVLDIDVHVYDATRPQALDKVQVKGRINGQWVVDSSMGTLQAAGIQDGFALLVGTNLDPDLANLPFSGAGTFNASAGVIKSLTFKKPATSLGFNEANPNLERYNIVARRIDKLTMFVGFSEDTNTLSKFGIGAVSIGSVDLKGTFRAIKVKNLTAASLIQLNVDDPLVGIVAHPNYTETSLTASALTLDGVLRLYT